MHSGKLPPVDVFGFGHCCIDYLTVLDPYPEKGRKGDVVQSIVIGGGPVPTALLTVTGFGASARFCGKVGDDHDGRVVIEGLKEGGVDISRMIVDPSARTARAYIWIDPRDGSRTVALDKTNITWPSADDLDEEMVKSCKVFLCDGRAADACVKGLKAAREFGVKTILDTGANRLRFKEMLELTDFAVVSSDLSDTLSPGVDPDELARLLVKMGTGTAVVTAGKDGALWCDGRAEGHVPGFSVDAVDTTGAGDVFHGGFIHGLLNNWELERSIAFANAAAALSCRHLSGQQGIPKLTEVEALLEW